MMSKPETTLAIDELIRKVVGPGGLVVVIRPTTREKGVDIEVTPATQPPTLEMMQEKIGGIVEFVGVSWCRYARKPIQIFVDKEGRLKSLPDNEFGTDFAQVLASVQFNLKFVGPVVMLIGSDVVWR